MRTGDTPILASPDSTRPATLPFTGTARGDKR